MGARMVSIYMYNRFGPWESFSHFVRTWYDRTTKDYREEGKMEGWYTPCHAFPQFEYTHDENGTKRLVRSVVKQEELKHLKHLPSGNSAARRNSTGGNSAITIAIKMSDEDDEHRNSGSKDDDDDDTNSICSRGSSMGSEELAELDNCASIRDLPETIREALLGM